MVIWLTGLSACGKSTLGMPTYAISDLGIMLKFVVLPGHLVMSKNLPAEIQLMVFGLILLLGVLYIPEGIVPWARRMWHKFSGTRLVEETGAA